MVIPQLWRKREPSILRRSAAWGRRGAISAAPSWGNGTAPGTGMGRSPWRSIGSCRAPRYKDNSLDCRIRCGGDPCQVIYVRIGNNVREKVIDSLSQAPTGKLIKALANGLGQRVVPVPSTEPTVPPIKAGVGLCSWCDRPCHTLLIFWVRNQRSLTIGGEPDGEA